MRRHKSKLVRNVVLFAVAVALLGALIIVVSVTRKPVLIMPPEGPEVIAMRTSPDNAYFALEDAQSLIPKTPEPLVGPDPEYPTLKVAYKPAHGSIGETLGIKRPDDDPELVQYVVACEPAIAKIREALKRPYYVEPIQWSDYEVFGANWQVRSTRDVKLMRLGRLLSSHGVQTQRVSGDDASASADLLDAVRLGLMLTTEGVSHSAGIRTQLDALETIKAWAKAPKSAESMIKLLKGLQTAEGELKPPLTALEFRWRVLDQIVHAPSDAPNVLRVAENTFLGWKLAGARKLVRRNKEALASAIAMEYPQYTQWVSSHPELRKVQFGDSVLHIDPMDEVESLARSRALLRASYRGAELVLAIEIYRREKNQYPETLAELVPAYLERLPTDPYTGGAYMYRRDGADYRLYGLGRNGKDDGGIPRKGDDLIVHVPPEPDK